MGERRDRDVEKVYSTSEFVAKLRRLRRLTNHEIVRSTIHRLAG